MPRRPCQQFIDWCKGAPADKENINRSLTLFNKMKGSEGAGNLHPSYVEPFIEEIQKIIKDGQDYNIDITFDIHSDFKGSVFDCDGTNYNKYLDTIALNNSFNQLEIINAFIRDLEISVSDRRQKIILRDCKICNLIISVPHRGDYGNISFDISNTDIGTFSVESKSVFDLEIAGGSILNIQCPSPSMPNPFIGGVSIKNVFFANNTRDYLLKNEQPYRNMRHHMQSLENSLVANIFHCLELDIEKRIDTGVNNLFNRGYKFFSNYGSSASRPLIGLLALILITFSWSFVSNGAVPATTNASSYVGWKETITQNSLLGDFTRSLILSTQSSINPLGIFSAKLLVVPKTGWLALWVMIQSLLSVLLIALLIFSVRRRFKLK